ncbi:TonB-dependent receptor [Marinifilum flexuosum]|uniref:Outer membrane receptor protein involved in Fe transport n=1 Tax=Marinifilum flexuosum TaxID=1117708 RepID=A0A419X6G4_9BACT|nr:carboxypeptidase-like regulatory domain-containing protein [Marinifilum flexuosum]RKE03321.1 outer membrane receptor protein involved in Fe transport [Marinifilum flexuosum]
MKNAMRSILTMAAVLMLSVAAIAQTTVKGVVVDGGSGESLPGASIVVPGTTSGTVSGFDGSFALQVPQGTSKIVVSFVGFLDKEIALSGAQDLGTIKLESDAVGLNEVSVMASIVTDRQTPVSVSTISTELIENKLGTQEFPEILKSTPSIYTSKEGGGFGDASVYVRGFDSNNVGVLINGIPVNDMESGKVYWSNWAGLSDVTRTMQVQRGLGASKLGLSSVGGTINVLLKSSDAKKGGVVKTSVANDGRKKQLFSVSTGLMDNGWAVTLLGSHTYGSMWAKGTEFDAWAYYANISKKINEKHSLAFMITGAPQWHNQRGNKHTIQQYRDHKDEFKYNSDYGIRDGKEYGGAYGYNYYHKPQAQLNHYWNIDDKTNLTTSLYASIGSGGGRRVDGAQKKWLGVDRYTGADYDETMRTGDGLLDFDGVAARNATYVAEGSQAIIGNSVNNHTWVGLLSTFTKDIENIKLTAGFDGRYYKGEHYKEIDDLLGGAFFLDGHKNRDDYTKLKKGDKYSYYNDGEVLYTGVFGQGEYVADDYSAFVSAAISRKAYKRVDYFNYLPGEQESDWEDFFPWNVKAGFNYKINSVHNVFVNGGYVQRSPYFRNVFLNYTNEVNENVKYEKIITAELGYGYTSTNFDAKVTAYWTNWIDKGLVMSLQGQTANITGLNQLHKGIEIEATYKPSKKLTVKGMLSVGDWVYEDDVNFSLYDDNNVLIDEFNAYIKDVHVGNSAQLTGALEINYEVLPKLRVGIDYLYNGRHFADFDPTNRTNGAEDRVDSWEMPDVSLVDMNFVYKFKIGNLDASVNGKVNNLFNVEYVSKADDGNQHNAASALVWYGYGTTWSTGLKVKF